MKCIFWIFLYFFFFSPWLIGSAPEVILFDYGGVIADVDRSALLHFLEDTLHVPYKTIKKDFARDRLYQSIQKPLSFWEAYSYAPVDSTWMTQLHQKKKEIVHPIPGMTLLLNQLQDAGLLLALLSNTEKARADFLRSSGEYQPFQFVLLSCDVGISKPNPKIFKLALKRLDCKPSQCLFIDDKRQNVDAAKKVGIDGIVFKSVENLIEELKKREIRLH